MLTVGEMGLGHVEHEAVETRFDVAVRGELPHLIGSALERMHNHLHTHVSDNQ